eukprot:6096218-Prymnesium_polylepis.2
MLFALLLTAADGKWGQPEAGRPVSARAVSHCLDERNVPSYLRALACPGHRLTARTRGLGGARLISR